ncbi:MAG: hypothetical protein B7X06_01960, partial [Verrucomicrobia bacterium 21-51-4]
QAQIQRVIVEMLQNPLVAPNLANHEGLTARDWVIRAGDPDFIEVFNIHAQRDLSGLRTQLIQAVAPLEDAVLNHTNDLNLGGFSIFMGVATPDDSAQYE